MKISVHSFIYNYVEFFAIDNNSSLKIEEIIDIKDGAMLELSNTLKILKKEDPSIFLWLKFHGNQEYASLL